VASRRNGRCRAEPEGRIPNRVIHRAADGVFLGAASGRLPRTSRSSSLVTPRTLLRWFFRSDGLEIIRAPIRAPKANALPERLVRTARSACLDWPLILSWHHLERVLGVFVHPYNSRRPHRSVNLARASPERPTLQPVTGTRSSPPRCRDRLDGLIRQYWLAA